MVDRSRLRRGSVWWIEAPDIPRRPACILTRSQVAPLLTRLVVVPATTTIRDIPTEVLVTTADGMPRTSVFNLDSVERVSTAYFRSEITALPHERMAEICNALAIATGC